MRNNFSQKTRLLFSENYSCWICGRNTFDCGHHIMGRGEKGSKVESSPLNFCPACNATCHIGQNMNDGELKKKLLNATHEYLLLIGYELTDKDREFMKKYEKYYEESLSFNPN